jgi:integrase
MSVKPGSKLGKVQTFLLSILQDRSRTAYIQALEDFKTDLDDRQIPWASFSESHQDEWLAEHVLEAKEAGVSRQRMQILCAALHKIHPRQNFVTTRKVLEVWKHEEPIRQAPACPEEIAYALAAAALAASQPGVAATILLCFTGLLRVSEALGATWTDIIFSGPTMVLALGKTKRGLDEKVVFAHPSTVSWFWQYRSRFGSRHKSVCNISYSKFRYWLNKLSKTLGLEELHLTSHSFRRGGASTLLHYGVPLGNIAVQGRWASESSCRDYLRRGELFLLRLKAQLDASVWAKLVTLSMATFELLEFSG